MKKFNLFSSAMVAALMLASCSAEDVVNNTTSETHTSYLTVSLANVGGSSFNGAKTRAEYEQPANSGNKYEDGTTEESALTNVRFYFFYANGEPYNLTTGVNYAESSQFTKEKENQDETVEVETKAQLVIESGTATKAEQMVAVVNPEQCTGLTNNGSLTLSQLKAITTTSAWKTAEGKTTDFLMSNSVYSDAAENGNECFQVVDIADYMKTSKSEAEKTPVKVYVERVAAKVRVKNSLTNGTKEFTDGSKGYLVNSGVEGVTSKKIYAKIQGWGVADGNDNANLVKKIDTKWTNSGLGINPWTSKDYHRCFWETTPSVGTYVNYKWSEYTTSLDDAIYTLPHTGDATRTKVLVAATLVDEDGKEVSWGNFNAVNYADEASLKAAILASVNGSSETSANRQYYVESGSDHVAVGATDVVLSATADPDYGVIAKTKDNVKVYKKNGETWEDATEDFNKALAEKPAQYYNSGMCYYQVDIKHLGSENATAEYGVVRNHIYDLTLTELKGFGTPVYDKDKVIDPTKPTVYTYYLAAKLNVLSWRVVSQNSVTLE